MKVNSENPFRRNQPKGLPEYKKYIHPDKKPFTPRGLPKYRWPEELDEIQKLRKMEIDQKAWINLEQKKRKTINVVKRLKEVDNASESLMKRFNNLPEEARKIAIEVLKDFFIAFDQTNSAPGTSYIEPDFAGINEIFEAAKKGKKEREYVSEAEMKFQEPSYISDAEFKKLRHPTKNLEEDKEEK